MLQFENPIWGSIDRSGIGLTQSGVLPSEACLTRKVTVLSIP